MLIKTIMNRINFYWKKKTVHYHIKTFLISLAIIVEGRQLVFLIVTHSLVSSHLLSHLLVSLQILSTSDLNLLVIKYVIG